MNTNKMIEFNKIVMRFRYIQSDNYSYKLLAKQANFIFTENLFLRSQLTSESQKKNYTEWRKQIILNMKNDEFPNHTTHG